MHVLTFTGTPALIAQAHSMRPHTSIAVFTAGLLLNTIIAHAQVTTHTNAAAIDHTLATMPAELSLAGGSLRIMNLYRAQAAILRAAAVESGDTIMNRLVREVYLPHTAFWNGYLGDESAFRSWAVELMDPQHPVHTRLPQLLDVALDRRFTDGVEWIERTTGRRPVGTWYIVFGPGWTDMGGLGDIGMVADFTRLRPDSSAIANLLPHELTHQVHGEGVRADPDLGTVLHRMISEGFASYVAWVYGQGRLTPARALGYSDDEWSWALEHEGELFHALHPILASRERADADRIAARNQQLIPSAPGAAGYFIGFRVIEAFVSRHGPDSWQQLYDMPLADVLTRSAYAPYR
jgi:hypothetical protein